MRVWDINPEYLCRQHLLGEHREVHAIFSIISLGKRGYSRHPETLRWVGKLGALWARHEKLAYEMVNRGYVHKSPIGRPNGGFRQYSFLLSQYEQVRLLQKKDCRCFT